MQLGDGRREIVDLCNARPPYRRCSGNIVRVPPIDDIHTGLAPQGSPREGWLAVRFNAVFVEVYRRAPTELRKHPGSAWL
jgi:hypothetical protein